MRILPKANTWEAIHDSANVNKDDSGFQSLQNRHSFTDNSVGTVIHLYFEHIRTRRNTYASVLMTKK